MRMILIAMMMLAVSGCVTLPKQVVPSYTFETTKIETGKNLGGEISGVIISASSLVFKFTNTTPKTSKIIWDDSAITLPDGTARRVLSERTKFSEAGRSVPPEIVPAGAAILTSASRADGTHYNPGSPGPYGSVIGAGWRVDDIVPCASNVEVARLKCDPYQFDGNPVSLLLAVENDGKKYEQRIQGVLRKNPAHVEWEKKNKAKSRLSENASSSSSPVK